MADEVNDKNKLDASDVEEKYIDRDDIIVDEEEGDYRKILKKLKDKMKVCESEKQNYLEGWQRVKADYINARKAEEKNLTELEPLIRERIFRELLSIPDNFEMAFSNKEAWEKVDKNWRVGIEGIYSNVINIFASLGIVQYGKEGDIFDTNEYQAVGAIPVDDKGKEDIILEIIQRGYKFRNKVLRPAKAKIGVLKENSNI